MIKTIFRIKVNSLLYREAAHKTRSIHSLDSSYNNALFPIARTLETDILPPISLATANSKELLRTNVAAVSLTLKGHECDTGT